MINKTFFSPFMHYLIYFFSAVVFSFFIGLSAPDDGLRHIVFAANPDIMKSWGNMYPFSLFGEYDPWFMWHEFLSIVLKVVSIDKLPIVVNLISLFVLMCLIHEFIIRNSKYNFASLIYIIVFIITLLTSYRYLMIRPDLLSGLYIMTALLLANKFRYIFILTLFYIPFYYLFFLYVGSVGLVYLIQKKLRAFLGVFISSILGLIFHLTYDFEGYISTVINILTDQKLRMGLAVSEGLPIFDFLNGVNYYLLVVIFLITSFFIIKYKYKYFKKNSIALFLLITSVLWLNQARYYHLFLPLIFVFIFVQITNMNKKRFFYLIRKYFIIITRYFNFSKNKKLFYFIAIPYSIFMLAYMFSWHSLDKSIKNGEYFTKKEFTNKTILSNKMDPDMFKAHYYNPTLKLIPSCSIGWFENKNPKMKELYVKLQDSNKTFTEEELKKLIDYTNTDYYIHYIRNRKQKLSFDKLTSLGIIPIEINQKKILFKVKK